MNSCHICADCSTPDPTWASINRGVFLCHQCCSVHRVLGTHISHIRSLSSTNWPPVLKEMVYTLVKKGANTVWEYQLHESHSKTKIKKPNPKDRIHPTKHDFIVSKYKHLSFLPRISSKDHFSSISDMSKQLHASVRTGNLETCLRLLALGADPNYMHSDRRNTPLHVAAQAGQAMQVELLVVNGADPCRLDRLGHTAEECARIAGHHQLADRLIECQYQLTDKLSSFVSGRKPQHNIGEHFLTPQVGHNVSPGMADAHNRLQEINNGLFEELVTDVYDEVDRRETDSLWLATQQLQSSIAFLPVNPTLSPLRNQGRQKLATLNGEEFAQLVIDILLDTKRRQALSVQTGETSGTAVPTSSEDKKAIFDTHDYDEVPVDDSNPPSLFPSGKPTSALPPVLQHAHHTSSDAESDHTHPEGTYSLAGGEEMLEDGISDYAELKDPPPHQSLLEMGFSSEGVTSAKVSRTKFDAVKDKLKSVQMENKQLLLTNHLLRKRCDDIQQQYNRVVEENEKLRLGHQRTSITSPPLPVVVEPIKDAAEGKEKEDGGGSGGWKMELYSKVDLSKKRPVSSTLDSRSCNNSSSSENQAIFCSSPLPNDDLCTLSLKKSIPSMATPPLAVTPPPPRQDTPLSDSPFEEVTSTTTPTSSSPRTTPTSTSGPPAVSTPFDLPGIPPLEEVQSYIKKITVPIQKLLQAAQLHQQTNFSTYSMQIFSTVDSLTKLFPRGCSPEVMTSLREVTHAAHTLKAETSSASTDQSDLAYRTRVIINTAYDVAKACRHLVTFVEQEAGSMAS